MLADMQLAHHQQTNDCFGQLTPTWELSKCGREGGGREGGREFTAKRNIATRIEGSPPPNQNNKFHCGW